MKRRYYKILGVVGSFAVMFTLVVGCGSTDAVKESQNPTSLPVHRESSSVVHLIQSTTPVTKKTTDTSFFNLGELLKTPQQVNQAIIQYLQSKGIRDISLPQLPSLHQQYYGVTVITDAKLPDSFVVQLTSMSRPYPLNAFAVNQSHLPMADLLGSYAVKPADQKDEKVTWGGGLITEPKGIASSFDLLKLQRLHGLKRFVYIATGITGTVYNTGNPYFPSLEFSYGHWNVIVSELINVHAGVVVGREFLQEIEKRGPLPGSGTFWVEMAGDGDHTQLAWTVNGKSFNIATQDTPELALNWLSHWNNTNSTTGN